MKIEFIEKLPPRACKILMMAGVGSGSSQTGKDSVELSYGSSDSWLSVIKDLYNLCQDLKAMKQKRSITNEKITIVKKQLKTYVDEQLEKGTRPNIVCVGMSHGSLIMYGGILSFLKDIKDETTLHFVMHNIHLYTFGSPFVVPPTFFSGTVNDPNSKILPRLLNMYHAGDLVLLRAKRFLPFWSFSLPTQLSPKEVKNQTCDYEYYDHNAYCLISKVKYRPKPEEDPICYGYEAHGLAEDYCNKYIFEQERTLEGNQIISKNVWLPETQQV